MDTPNIDVPADIGDIGDCADAMPQHVDLAWEEAGGDSVPDAMPQTDALGDPGHVPNDTRESAPQDPHEGHTGGSPETSLNSSAPSGDTPPAQTPTDAPTTGVPPQTDTSAEVPSASPADRPPPESPTGRPGGPEREPGPESREGYGGPERGF